jgi:cytochrome P450
MITQPTVEDELAALLQLRPDLIENPYPLFDRLRREAPAAVVDGVVCLSRYDDVDGVIRDLDHFSARRSQGTRLRNALDRLNQDEQKMLLEDLAFVDRRLSMMDPPDHTRVRALSHKVFTPRRVTEMRERVQAIADELLERAVAQGTFDLVTEFAYELPLFVIGEMLGAPRKDAERIRNWSMVLADLSGTEFKNVATHHSTLEEFRGYIRTLIAERRRTRHTDLLAALLEVEDGGERLTQVELESMFILLLFAGHETATNTLANGVLALHRNPDQLRRLVEQPDLVPAAVEEILRYDSAVQVTYRTVVAESKVGGSVLQPGTTIRLMVAAANRDPDHFIQPDRFDIERADQKHLAFGVGPHYCLGQALARMELQIGLTTLLAACPSLEIVGDVEWKRNFGLRGPRRLVVRAG